MPDGYGQAKIPIHTREAALEEALAKSYAEVRLLRDEIEPLHRTVRESIAREDLGRKIAIVLLIAVCALVLIWLLQLK
jgi:hypothetical protein